MAGTESLKQSNSLTRKASIKDGHVFVTFTNIFLNFLNKKTHF